MHGAPDTDVQKAIFSSGLVDHLNERFRPCPIDRRQSQETQYAGQARQLGFREACCGVPSVVQLPLISVVTTQQAGSVCSTFTPVRAVPHRK